MQPRNRFFGFCLLAASVLTGCYDGAPISEFHSDLAITVHDESQDFSKNRTWAMPDTVWPIMYTDVDGVSDSLDSLVLEEINIAMISYGYQRILDPSPENQPDVYLTAANMATFKGLWNVQPVYEPYCLWWSYCDDCCAPGWFPDYPQAYPTGFFTRGTLFIDMYDPGAIDQTEGSIPVIWAAVAHGVMEINQAHAEQNTRSAIRRAFAQSPYLNLN